MELKHVTLIKVDPVTGEEGPGKIHICKKMKAGEEFCQVHGVAFYARPLCGRYPYLADDGGWAAPWDEFTDEKVLPSDVVYRTCARLAAKYQK